MKILCILGSPRGNKGNTAALLRLVLAAAESRGAETEVIYIRGGEVKPCKACNTCHRKGVCPQKDSFNAIKEKALAADGIVLASPNYIFHVSAQIKAFLDRSSGLLHVMAFEGKYAASVVTSGGGEDKPIADYMNKFLARMGAVPVGSVWAKMGNIQGQDFPEDIRKKASALGKKLVKDWEDKKTPRGFEKQSALFRERMQSLMLWRKNEWPYEYEYWKKNRGLKG